MSPWKGASFESDDSKEKAARAINVEVQKGYHCDSNYDLKVHTQAEISPTGLLVIAELRPKKSSLPSFSFRWDEKDDSLDVDIQGVTDIIKDCFKKEIRGYAGHHPKRITSAGRTFEADIRIPQMDVFYGRFIFNLVRDMELRQRVKFIATETNSVDTAQR